MGCIDRNESPQWQFLVAVSDASISSHIVLIEYIYIYTGVDSDTDRDSHAGVRRKMGWQSLAISEISQNLHRQKALPNWAFPKVKAFNGERVETTKASCYRGLLAPRRVHASLARFLEDMIAEVTIMYMLVSWLRCLWRLMLIWNGFSIINHPFWGTHIYGKLYIELTFFSMILFHRLVSFHATTVTDRSFQRETHELSPDGTCGFS